MAGIPRLTQYQRFTASVSGSTSTMRASPAGVLFGTIPAGAMLVLQNVRVNTAFNAGTTNALNVGTTAGGTQVFTDAATAGARSPAIPNLSFAVDTDLFVAYAQTGGAATAGQADIVVGFAPNNDQ
jgi:hypothetical protein